MKSPIWVILLFLSGLFACGQDSTIVYSGYRWFYLAPVEYRRGFDLDGDGTNDFVAFGQVIGAAALGSDNVSFYMLVGAGVNQLLLSDSSEIALLSAGTLVGGGPPTNTSWGNYDQFGWGNLLGSYVSGAGIPKPYWVGNFSTQCVGFVGLRVYRADGWHFGWMRVRALPLEELFSIVADGCYTDGPEIIDWAYESRPGVPIAAGDGIPSIPFSDGGIVLTNGTADVDVNCDGRSDLRFICTNGGFSIQLPKHTRLAMIDICAPEIYRFARGAVIGPSTSFSGDFKLPANVRVCNECGCFGWLSTEGFLGVELRSGSVTNYGWLQIAVPPDDQPGVFIRGWASNPQPGEPIAAGAVVHAPACSVGQLVPCDGSWKNHGEYVNAVKKVAERFARDGLVSEEERRRIVSEAARSDCGKAK